MITILPEMLDFDCGLDLTKKDLIDSYLLDLILDCVDLCLYDIPRRDTASI